MQRQAPRRDGIFDDERVLLLARAMTNAFERLFSRLYALARSRSRGDDAAALRLFVDGLPSIREWTRETVASEARHAKRTQPRVDVSYRYALMRYVRELYSEEPADVEVEFTPPPFEAFVWHFYRIAARKPHVVSGAFLTTDERATQRFVRAAIRDTFDRLLRSALRVRKLAGSRPEPEPAVPAVSAPAPAASTFDERVREAMARRRAKALSESAVDVDADGDDVCSAESDEDDRRNGDADAEESADDAVDAPPPPAAVAATERRRRAVVPTRSRARDLEALGRSRRSRAAVAAAEAKTPSPSSPPEDGGGDVVLDGISPNETAGAE